MRHRFTILLLALLTLSMLIGVMTTVMIDRTERQGLQTLDEALHRRQEREELLRRTAWLYAVPMVDLAHKFNLGILDSTTVHFRLKAVLAESDLSWHSYAEEVPLEQRQQLTDAQARVRRTFAQLIAILSSDDTTALHHFVEKSLYPATDPFTVLAEEQMRQEVVRTEATLSETREAVRVARSQAINLAIVGYILTVFGGAAMVFYLIRRVKAVQNVAEAIARNDLDMPPPLHGNDEIGQIHNNLLTLHERLQTQWEEISAQNEELSATLADLERSQTALAANEARWKLALSASESGIWEHDLLRNRIALSPGWKAQLGFAPDELADDFDSWALRLHPDDAHSTLGAYKDYIDGKRGDYRIETRLMHKDGSWHWMLSCGMGELDSAGNIVRVVGTQADITARKVAEAAMINARDEAENALLQLQSTQQQMLQSEKLAALGGLVAGIAHEVNTPLGIAVTAASTLQEEAQRMLDLLANGQMKKSELDAHLLHNLSNADLLRKHVEHAANLIRSLKQISVDQSIDERRPFKPADYFQDILASLAPKFRHTPHRYTFTCADELQFDSYPAAFTQIFTNLVTNALLHGFEHSAAGLLVISVDAQGKNNAIIEFADNGAGMPAAERQRIFEPFFTTKRGRGGSGLGLAIVYNLVVSRLGGKISVKSTQGKGTTFTLVVPLKAPAQTLERPL